MSMVAWPEITCQRGCDHHATRRVLVDMYKPHAYADYPQIPSKLCRVFPMYVWDPDRHPVDGGAYCPAHDAVSETITNTGIWEPSATILALTVMSSAPRYSVVVDIGAQIGWYSLLAASYYLEAVAVDADAENLRLLKKSAHRNDWDHLITYYHLRIGPDTGPFATPAHIRFAKIDVEGAESDAVKILWSHISSGNVDHILMEVTPIFADYYPELVRRIIDAGYHAYPLPPKQIPPYPVANPAVDLEAFQLTDTADVATWRQADVWFKRAGASW